MRALVDAQLPPALARLIADHGHEASHVFDVGLGSAGDSEVCRYALEHDFAVVTKDVDFVSSLVLVGAMPAIIWVRTGNSRKQTLLNWFAPQIEHVANLVDAGERLVELR